MDKVIYSKNRGLGIIMDADDKESDYIKKGYFILNGTRVSSGDKTNLFGLFTSDVTFVGALKDDCKCMVFLLGDKKDLFDYKRYYACYYWISETRVLNIYKEGSARDFNFINGKWK